MHFYSGLYSRDAESLHFYAGLYRNSHRNSSIGNLRGLDSHRNSHRNSQSGNLEGSDTPSGQPSGAAIGTATGRARVVTTGSYLSYFELVFTNDPIEDMGVKL